MGEYSQLLAELRAADAAERAQQRIVHARETTPRRRENPAALRKALRDMAGPAPAGTNTGQAVNPPEWRHQRREKIHALLARALEAHRAGKISAEEVSKLEARANAILSRDAA